jgi:hypothetical protein
LLLRHPRAVLVFAAIPLVVLGIIGIGVQDRLDPTTIDVPGTESLRSNETLRVHFGASAPSTLACARLAPARSALRNEAPVKSA